jgi:hypothetical protein
MSFNSGLRVKFISRILKKVSRTFNVVLYHLILIVLFFVGIIIRIFVLR